MARLIDFLRGQSPAPAIPVAPVITASTPAPSTVSPVKRVTPEALIDDVGWGFKPESATEGVRYYSEQTVHDAALIYIARSLGRLANDVEVIRKHMTRLQLVRLPEDPAA